MVRALGTSYRPHVEFTRPPSVGPMEPCLDEQMGPAQLDGLQSLRNSVQASTSSSRSRNARDGDPNSQAKKGAESKPSRRSTIKFADAEGEGKGPRVKTGAAALEARTFHFASPERSRRSEMETCARAVLCQSLRSPVAHDRTVPAKVTTLPRLRPFPSSKESTDLRWTRSLHRAATKFTFTHR